MTQEMIDKCLDFAEGNKGKFTILMAKTSEFPENLLVGTTEKQRTINKYVSMGYTTRQIAEIMECTQPNIMEHIRQYRKGKSFYYIWKEFWDVSENIRKEPIFIAFADVLSSNEIEKYKNKGIETVGDYLRFSVTMKSGKLCGMLQEMDTSNKEKIFRCIRNMCYEKLTVRTKL